MNFIKKIKFYKLNCVCFNKNRLCNINFLLSYFIDFIENRYDDDINNFEKIIF